MVTRSATSLLMLTGLRTIELRASEWDDIDLDKDLWQIPAERMKMRRPHVVPLSILAAFSLKLLPNRKPAVS